MGVQICGGQFQKELSGDARCECKSGVAKDKTNFSLAQHDNIYNKVVKEVIRNASIFMSKDLLLNINLKD